MRIDIVNYHDEEGVFGVYLDGKLYEEGDSYHNHMRDWIPGWLRGIKCMFDTAMLEATTEEQIEYLYELEPEINCWRLETPYDYQFAEEGYKVPMELPNKYSHLMTSYEDYVKSNRD